MARPNETRRTQRVQVNIASAPTPEAGVYAPLTGAAMPSQAALGLQSLAQALGAVVPLGAEVVKERNEHFYKRGKADEELGKVDEKLRQRNEAYERGVNEAVTLRAYNDAVRAALTRAAQGEVDRTKPWDEQVAQLDRLVMEEMDGVLDDDPSARVLVADRYRTFIEQAANNILEQTTQEHRQLVVGATLTDSTDDLRRGGDGRPVEAIERIATVTGDRIKAAEAWLGSVLQVAHDVAQNGDIATARAEVERILATIPDEVKLSDGTVLRPKSIPSLAATINDSQVRAIDLVDRREKEEAQKALLDYGKYHIDATNAGVLIPWSWYEDLARRGVITDQQALSWYDANQSAFAARKKKESSEHMLTQWLLDPAKDWRWYVGLTLPDGTVTTEKMFQERFDYLAQQALAQGGPEAFGAVVSLSKSTGLAYTPMKTVMSQLNGDNVESVAQYFPMYQQLRAAGMAGMYVDEKAMPYWMLAEALHQAGVDPTSEQGKAQMRDRLKRYEPERARRLVEEGRVAIRKKIDSAVVHDGFARFDTKVNDLINVGYAKGEIMRLAELHLQLGVDPDTALENALQQIQMSHTVIKVNDDEEYLLPNEPGVDMEELQDALDFFKDEVLPQAAARAGHTKDEVRFEVTRGVGGRGTEVRIVNFAGTNISEGGRFWSPQDVISMYREATGEAEAAKARRLQRWKADMERVNKELEASGLRWEMNRRSYQQ